MAEKELKRQRSGNCRISQCIIVKNEEKNIERALSWGRDIMWERVVVDTGSTDRTVELAEKMGATVHFFPWADDFAAAKNYALEKAQGDWIAFLDADEYMMPEDAAKLKEILDGAEGERFDGISTGWQQLDEKGTIFSSGTQVRFFRNVDDIRYRRRIHEQLESTSGRELILGDVTASLSIFHTGYQKQAMEEKTRSGRNRKLISKELEDHPHDYEMQGYMGDEFFGEGDRREAEKWYRKSIRNMPAILRKNDQRSASTYTNLLIILTEGEGSSWDTVGPIYQSAVEHLPEEADFDYIAGRHFASIGQAGLAVKYLEFALDKLNRFGCFNKALRLAGNLMDAYDLLVRCCFEAGEKEKCVSYGAACLRYDKYAMAVLAHMLMCLAPNVGRMGEGENLYGQVLTFLSSLYDMGSLKEKVFLWKTADSAGCSDFAFYLGSQVFSEAERSALGI